LQDKPLFISIIVTDTHKPQQKNIERIASGVPAALTPKLNAPTARLLHRTPAHVLASLKKIMPFSHRGATSGVCVSIVSDMAPPQFFKLQVVYPTGLFRA
jgi:hypothetical protein